jgi:hypothetical protein
MMAEVFGGALYLFLLFCTLWLSFAGLFSRFHRATVSGADGGGPSGCTGNAYELLRRVG